MELHLQVRTARKQAGLTQEELAAKANVGRTDVSRFERGENVTMKTFLRIVGALPNLKDLTIGDLHMRKEGASIPNEGVLMRGMASAFLQNLADQGAAAAPSAPPPAEGPPPRELSLLRTFALLIMELTGGSRQP